MLSLERNSNAIQFKHQMDVRFNGFDCSLLLAYAIPKDNIAFVNR